MAARQFKITWLTFVTCFLFLSDSIALDCGLASIFLLGTPKRRQRKQQEAQPTGEEPEPHVLFDLVIPCPVSIY